MELGWLWPKHRVPGLGSEWSSRVQRHDSFRSYNQSGADGGRGHRVRSGMRSPNESQGQALGQHTEATREL